MEQFHLPYDAIVSMPTTRRHRLIKWKLELEKKREDAQRQQAAQSRSRKR